MSIAFRLFPQSDMRSSAHYPKAIFRQNKAYVDTHLLSKLLAPTLIATADPNSVFAVRVSSSAAEAPFAPKCGVPMVNLDRGAGYRARPSNFACYCISKGGNYL
ncbi:Uu.00g105550.m01.CDS01 [Anthostomella pinea]|uniref:Uu.00g105550.m01.CDS01 n=1 Tax=Anthostomella pinea TaxID=933095 RepID=A0AAI8YDE0_9PEZI|nr:Uu.00g105550.m01.CDS01 [Anthostomella pinea]